jgi:exonuclease SbcC
MIIKSLSLENIRSYKKETIIFEKGINFLSGDIGVGKSSILLAIEFALFGFKKGELEGHNLLRKGCNEALVNILLNRDSREIEIIRSIKKTKNGIIQDSTSLRINNSIEEMSPSELNAKIFEILNLPREFLTKDKNLIYRFTVYTAQEQLKEIIFTQADKRLELIRKLFSIDKYKQIKDSINIYNGKLREDKRFFQKALEEKQRKIEEINIIEKDIKIYTDDLDKIKKNESLVLEKIKQIQKEIINKKEVEERLKNNLFKLEKAIVQLLELEKQKQSLIIKNNDYKSQIENLNKSKNVIEVLEKKVNSLIISLKENSKEINLLRDEIQKINNKKESLSKLKEKYLIFKNKLTYYNDFKKSFDLLLTKCQIKDKNLLLEKLNLRYRKLEKNLDKIEKENLYLSELFLNKNSIEKEIEKKKEKEASIKNITDCPLCLQKVSNLHKESISIQFNKEISKLELDLSNFNEKIITHENKIKKIKESLEDKDKLLIEIAQTQEKLSNLEEKKLIELENKNVLENLEKEIIFFKNLNLKFEIESLEDKIKDDKKINLKLQALYESEKKQREDLEETRDKLNKINLSKEKIKTFKDEINTNNILIQNLDGKLSRRKKYDIMLKENKEKEFKINKILLALNEEDENLNIEKSNFQKDLIRLKTLIEEKKKILEKEYLRLSEFNKMELLYKKIIEDENFLNNEMINVSDIIEKSILSRYYLIFNESFEMIFKDLIEDSEIEVRLDETFSPVIEQNGYDIEIKNLSGGEKSSLALAYRLALKKTLEVKLSRELSLDILILDEPSEGFSQYQIERFSQILKDSNIAQIILVSHDSKIENIADKIFYLEKIRHQTKILN